MGFIIGILIIFEFLLILSMYIKEKNIIKPCIIFGAYYLVQIVFGVLFFKEVKFKYYGILFVICGLIFFTIGSIFNRIILNKSRCIVKKRYFINIKISTIILSVSTILALAIFIIIFMRKNIVISSMFRIEYWLKINNKLALQRYSGNSTSQNSVLGEVMLICTYFSPLIGGFNFNFYNKNKTKILSLISLLPSFCIVAVQNTKSTWIAGCLLFLSGYIVSSVIIRGGLKKISLKKIIYIAICAVIFIGINYISMITRIGKVNYNSINIVNKKIMVYALGHIPTFDIWFSNNMFNLNYKFGSRTFYGIANFIGIDKRVQGIYNEFTIFSSESSNIYTMFRPYLEDFGIVMGLVMLFILGIIFENIFNRIRKSRGTKIEIVLLASFYFYILYGFITSTWAYISFIAIFVLFMIYLLVVLKCNYIEKERKC